MNIDLNTQWDILRIVAGILHLGNITFIEKGSNASQPADPSCKYNCVKVLCVSILCKYCV